MICLLDFLGVSGCAMLKSLRGLFVIFVLFLGVLAAQSIPRAQADTLSGGKITLPDAALGHPAIFTIGFSRAGGDATGRWNRELKKQHSATSDAHFYTVAVLQDAPKMVRGMIRHGMRGGIPKDEQDTFVLIYEGENAWKTFAGFSGADDAYVVVNSTGTARARVHGKTPDEASLATVKDALAKAASPTQ
jgi:hypothetical protein